MPSLRDYTEFQEHPTLYITLQDICAQLNPESYLEVGTREGCSLQTVVQYSPRLSKIVCCDTWESENYGSGRGSHSHISVLLDQLGYTGIRSFLDGDSTVLLPWLNEQFDLILIDGNHTDTYAERDAREGWRLLKPSGVLIMDDIRNPAFTLRPVFDRLLREFKAADISLANDVGMMQKLPMAMSAR